MRKILTGIYASRHRVGLGTIPVYDFYGQSNIAGQGILADAPVIESGLIPMAKVWNKSTLAWDDFETGVNNGNNEGKYSLISKFAWLMYLDDPLVTRYYFIEAISATSMATTWNVNTQHTADVLADHALMLASGDFYVESIGWLQGEGDCNELVDANAYQASEADMIDLYKTSFGSNKFISSKLGFDASLPTKPYKSIVNAAKDTNQAGGKSSDLIISDGLPLAGDLLHFNSAGLEMLGQRFHDVYFDNGISKAFKLEITTTVANTIFTLPIVGDDESSGTIDWGDGSALVDNLEANRQHTFVDIGVYEIVVDGMITEFNFAMATSSRNEILDVTNWGINQFNNFGIAGFQLCTNLTLSATDTLKSSGINMSSFFKEADGLSWGANMDGAEVYPTDLSACFDRILDFNSSIAWLKTENNTTLNAFMRSVRSFNLPVIDLCQAACISLTDFAAFGRLFNQPVDSWVTSGVRFMLRTFQGHRDFDQPLYWNFSSVEDMSGFMNLRDNTQYSTTNMDILLNRLDDATFGLNIGIMTNVNLDFGTIDYTSAGAAALASLIVKGHVVLIGNEV